MWLRNAKGWKTHNSPLTVKCIKYQIISTGASQRRFFYSFFNLPGQQEIENTEKREWCAGVISRCKVFCVRCNSLRVHLIGPFKVASFPSPDASISHLVYIIINKCLRCFFSPCFIAELFSTYNAMTSPNKLFTEKFGKREQKKTWKVLKTFR